MIRVVREVKHGIGGAFSSMCYMNAEGDDVNWAYAALFKTKAEALEAARKHNWIKRFRKRVQLSGSEE